MHFSEIRREEVSRIHPVQDKNHLCALLIINEPTFGLHKVWGIY